MSVVFLVLMFVLSLMLFPTFGSLLKLALAMLIWMVVGNIAGNIVRGDDYGVAGNIALGLAGGVVGTFVLRLLGWWSVMRFPLVGAIITGVIGALVFIFLMRVTIDKNFGK